MKISKERIAIGLLVATIVTNPLTGQYILQGLDWVFQQMFLYGSWISLVAGVYVIGLIAYMQYRAGRVNIPKTSKNKVQYIKT